MSVGSVLVVGRCVQVALTQVTGASLLQRRFRKGYSGFCSSGNINIVN